MARRRAQRKPARLPSGRHSVYTPGRSNGQDIIVKVIASQIRKGNVVEDNSQLYVVLKAESFFPGKGTPTTQIDMRRLSDGTKVSQRYKTTEQVERAFIETREHNYLFEDGDGFTFMN